MYPFLEPTKNAYQAHTPVKRKMKNLQHLHSQRNLFQQQHTANQYNIKGHYNGRYSCVLYLTLQQWEASENADRNARRDQLCLDGHLPNKLGE